MTKERDFAGYIKEKNPHPVPVGSPESQLYSINTVLMILI